MSNGTASVGSNRRTAILLGLDFLILLVVESLLDFRRMEAGTHPYQRSRLPAAPLVEGVVDDFRREATVRGNSLQIYGSR